MKTKSLRKESEQKKLKSGRRRQRTGAGRPVNKKAEKYEQVKAEEIRSIAEPLCETEGMELVHVEYQREAGGRVLRLYIDRPGGVMLDDCVCVSRQVGDLLDVSFENMGPYNLEVTSPGSDRPLGKEHDFERFRGHRAKIRFIQSRKEQKLKPDLDQRTLQGVLMGVSEGIVRLMVDGETVSIPFQEITRARLVPEKS